MHIPDHIDRNDFDALADWMESDEFDPDPSEFHDGTVLRRIAATSEVAEQARSALDDEVAAARQAGLSWTLIGLALGVSRQAAQQRFRASAHTRT